MYPNTLYRVSVKAYITDEQGRVFVVKENDSEGKSFWGLPGGGLDHGELAEECLKREIREELGIEEVTVGEIAYTKSFYLSNKKAWLLWVIYNAQIHSTDYIFDDGVTDADYLRTEDLASSTDMFERAIVEVDHTIRAASRHKNEPMHKVA